MSLDLSKNKTRIVSARQVRSRLREGQGLARRSSGRETTPEIVLSSPGLPGASKRRPRDLPRRLWDSAAGRSSRSWSVVNIDQTLHTWRDITHAYLSDKSRRSAWPERSGSCYGVNTYGDQRRLVRSV